MAQVASGSAQGVDPSRRDDPIEAARQADVHRDKGISL